MFSISLFKKKGFGMPHCELLHLQCYDECEEKILCYVECDLKYKDIPQEEEFVNCKADICTVEYEECQTDKGSDDEECFTNFEICVGGCRKNFIRDYRYKPESDC